ncbi:3-hydroxyacyl-CoA dehydrogenase [uncultured delta proteobacterium]|uniref:3-hydroxyacyl-CoA dehydrogenase n=1 Tax=uncultured delta proteobacterium TaxID=34034 RepID=A0A212KAJ8_9DELT|nr:3-hydroxyacyl-CoA dehydrogenase [uncultured delta proteobacterium]
MTMRFSTAAVIGSGIMGHGIALVCARGGVPVTLVDISKDALRAAEQKFRASMMQLVASGMAPADSPERVLAAVRYSSDMEEGVKDADIVFEAVPEKLALKESVYGQLDAFCKPETVFASNTSGIPINTLAALTKRPENFAGTHFFMPAHLIPLVEVIQGDKTATGVIDALMSFLTKLGKSPVHVRVDIPGFIANRLQHALAREAMSLVEKGVASAEDVDMVVKTSLAVRLLFTGPIEQRDFNGLDTHLSIAEYLYPDLENSTVPLLILTEKVRAGNCGIKSGKGFFDWTQEDLAGVAARKNSQLIQVLTLLKNA